MNFSAKSLCLFLIRLYQASAAGWRPRCRFWPSCSEYAREAIEAHGAGPGALLGVKRIVRCHPLGRSGFDPVPAKP